jgi:glucose/arabinose dehydrogenase
VRTKVLAGLLVVLIASYLAAFFTDGGRRLVVALLSGSGPVAAAAVPTLEPTFDGADAGRPQLPVRLVPVVRGVAQPTDVAQVPGHPAQLVILGKQGTAWLATEGGEPSEWFSVSVRTTSELGLLGIAFHPKFDQNGLFFLNVNPSDGELRTRISRWRVDPATLQHPREDGVVLEIDQPYQNHDGGQLAFGPDGMLYVGMGDGGYRGDPKGHGQDRSTLLGDLLRIDVDTLPYGVPPDNPFVGVAGVRPEIWASGLRNPWRFTFDPRGRLVVADVGQDTLEEIDLVGRGDNLGWSVREGDRCYSPSTGCPIAGFVDPIWTYPRTEGISVTGGVVWTGPGPLAGRYLFADFGTGRIWALELPDRVERVPQVTALGRFDLSPTAFGRAADGGVLVADFRAGAVFRITPSRTAEGRPE